MDQATMRTTFKTRLAQLGDTQSEAQIDVYLNRAYRWTIPDLVPGFLTNDKWDIATTTASTSYEFPDYVHSIHGGSQHYDGNALTEWFDSEAFFFNTGGVTAWAASSGKPTDILFDQAAGARVVAVYPNSDQVAPAAYQIKVGIRAYGQSDIATDGIVNETHAMAVVSAAVLNFAEDYNLDEIAARENGRFVRRIGLLKSRSLNMPQEYIPQRTF